MSKWTSSKTTNEMTSAQIKEAFPNTRFPRVLKDTFTVMDGTEVITLTKVIPPEPEPPTEEEIATALVEAKTLAMKRIDRMASTTRAAFISSEVGQAVVYQEKYAEAQRYRRTSNPADADYPYLALEAAELGGDATVASVAATVVATRNAWAQLSPTIESKRVGHKAKANAAANADGVEAALVMARTEFDAIKAMA